MEATIWHPTIPKRNQNRRKLINLRWSRDGPEILLRPFASGRLWMQERKKREEKKNLHAEGWPLRDLTVILSGALVCGYALPRPVIIDFAVRLSEKGKPSNGCSALPRKRQATLYCCIAHQQKLWAPFLGEYQGAKYLAADVESARTYAASIMHSSCVVCMESITSERAPRKGWGQHRKVGSRAALPIRRDPPPSSMRTQKRAERYGAPTGRRKKDGNVTYRARRARNHERVARYCRCPCTAPEAAHAYMRPGPEEHSPPDS